MLPFFQLKKKKKPHRNKYYLEAGPVKEESPGVQITQIFVPDVASHSGPWV